MSEPKIEPAKKLEEEAEQKNLAHFIEDYSALCKNYGLMIGGELVYSPTGIWIKPVVVKRPKDDSIISKE